MSSWAERVHRRAADLGSVVTSCGHPTSSPAYPYRLEKVKFGVPLDEVCKNNNIPGPLLVLILKLNKESPNRRDVFRAPGHQGAMKKLIHFLQCGRLVNVDNYSVYTIASVLKKFLRKIPNGIFGRSGENELFTIIELDNEIEQQERIHRLITSLPNYTQHLLVLLFGTFRVIASNASHACTGMTSEALGVSVAPSFFQSCVSDGKTARMEDVLKFKVATKIMKHIIDKFAVHDMFGRGNYEYYARVTGRILKVQDEWICSFQYPPPPRGKLAQQKYALQHSLEAEKTWLQCQCERWGLIAQEESRSTPALLTSSSSALENSVLSLGVSAEHSFMESCARLSVSLEGPSLFALAASSSIPNEVIVGGDDEDDDDNGGDGDGDDDDVDDDVCGGNLTNGEEDDDEEENEKEHRVAMRARDDKENKSNVTATAATTATTATTTGVQRRYRRNKQNVTNTHRQLHHHHHHHLHHHQSQRSKMKSSDVASDTDCISPPNHRYNSQKSAKISSGSVDGLTSRTAAAAATAACSRCSRGIRHSSSCCSSSTHSSKSVSAGGVGADQANTCTNSGNSNSNSHMTMDELRAVNRYAESTKSLSYLPQVHERQTARMRTRSEWFLGPKGAISVEMKTCANCYLLHNHHHHQFHRQHHQLLNVDGNDDELFDVDDGCDGCDGCGCGGGGGVGGGSTNNVQTFSNEIYPMLNRRQQQQQQQQQQQHGQQYHQHHHHHRHQHHNIENMDTDDSDYSPHSNLNFFSLDSTMLRGIGSGVAGRDGGGGVVDIANPSQLPTTAAASRIFLKTNFSTISAGNIRLSNSAESVQCPFRRISRRGLLMHGTARHHPHRSSLRRNNNNNSKNKAKANNNGGRNENVKNPISCTCIKHVHNTNSSYKSLFAGYCNKNDQTKRSCLLLPLSDQQQQQPETRTTTHFSPLLQTCQTTAKMDAQNDCDEMGSGTDDAMDTNRITPTTITTASRIEEIAATTGTTTTSTTTTAATAATTLSFKSPRV